jgi:hypothetical protein
MVLILKAPNNKLESLLPLMPDVRKALKLLKAGDIAKFGK